MKILKDKGFELLVFVPLTIMLISLGYYMLYPVSVTYDPSMHAQIVNIIGEQGYPDTWEPYAQQSFTYTPFFHYLAFLLSLTGIYVIDAVRIIGILAYILIPISTYLWVSSYYKKNKVIPALSALVIAFLPLMGNIFLLGEFPEVLSIELLILLLYSIKTKRHFLVALFAGLTLLTHPFMVLVAVVLFLYNIKNLRGEDNKTKLLYFLIFAIVSGFWAIKYWEIMGNIASGTWHNVVYNTQQPYLWFWAPHQILDFLFGFNQLGYLVFFFSLIGFWKIKDRFLRVFYLFCLVFTIYHLPYTQLKILDLFSIPISIFAAVGIWTIVNLFKKNTKILVVGIIIFLLAFFQVWHYVDVRTRWFTDSTLDNNLLDATLWLENYDESFVRIYSDRGSSWVGILANKIPLYPYITDLEAYSDEYKEQLEDIDKIKESIDNSDTTQLEQLLEKHEIKFMFTSENVTANYLNRVYFNEGWNLYEVTS